jgi:hypothetical protein
MKNTIIEVEKTAINEDIFEIKFECDLKKCKGACCTMESEYGAPLNEDEIEVIEKKLPIVKKYLSKEHIKELESNGFWYRTDGYLMVRSVNKRECVFAYYENDIAFCAIEKAFINKEIDYKKPISCHLFPIRIANFGGPVLYFEEYKECAPALEKGLSEGTTVFEFCKNSLERLFGAKWYKLVKEYKRGINA